MDNQSVRSGVSRQSQLNQQQHINQQDDYDQYGQQGQDDDYNDQYQDNQSGFNNDQQFGQQSNFQQDDDMDNIQNNQDQFNRTGQSNLSRNQQQQQQLDMGRTGQSNMSRQSNQQGGNQNLNMDKTGQSFASRNQQQLQSEMGRTNQSRNSQQQFNRNQMQSDQQSFQQSKKKVSVTQNQSNIMGNQSNVMGNQSNVMRQSDVISNNIAGNRSQVSQSQRQQTQNQFLQANNNNNQQQGRNNNLNVTNNNNNQFNQSFVSVTQQKQPEKTQQYSQFIRKDNENYDDVVEESQVIHHQNYTNRALNAKFISCSRDHSENRLNLICLNTSCPYLLDPVCIECVESKEPHKHTDKVRGLKKFYENLSVHIDKTQADLYKRNVEDKQWFLNTAQTFQDLSDKCLEIRRNVLFMMRDIFNGEPYDVMKEAKKTLDSIYEARDEKEFKSLLKDLNTFIDINGDNITVKKAGDIRNLQKNIDIYRSRVTQELLTIQEKVDLTMRSTFSTDYSPLLWTFQKQKMQQSQMIKELDKGLLFEGSKQVQQIIYGSQFFERGRHGFKLQMVSFNPKSENITIGLATPANKNLDLLQMKDTPYACLYNKQQKYGMIAVPPQFNILDTLPQGGFIHVTLDIRSNSFEIYSQDKKVTYKLQNYYLKGKTLGFFIALRGSGARIKLIESY